MASLRLVHFSDLHITSDPLRLGVMDWFGKRSTGWLNARIGRGKRFRKAFEISQQLSRQLQQHPADLLLFSGDATVLGMQDEYRRVGTALAPLLSRPGMAVPGNHDYYTQRSVRSRWFETLFEPWQQGFRVDDATYPFAVEKNGYWIIAANSSCPNVTPWDSRGRVGEEQRERLNRLFRALPAGPRILMTHYPVCLKDGKPEMRFRRLRDALPMIRLCGDHGVRFWMHGHRHIFYHRVADGRIPFDVICAGSATQQGRWGYSEYVLEGDRLEILRHRWNHESDSFSAIVSG